MGRNDIIAVDDLTDGTQMFNLADCEIADYLDKDDFIKQIQAGDFDNALEVIFHQCACSSTTEWDGKFMMANNYEYSKTLLHYSQANNCQFIYASSASVYGGSEKFIEQRELEKPLGFRASILLYQNISMSMVRVSNIKAVWPVWLSTLITKLIIMVYVVYLKVWMVMTMASNFVTLCLSRMSLRLIYGSGRIHQYRAFITVVLAKHKASMMLLTL